MGSKEGGRGGEKRLRREREGRRKGDGGTRKGRR